jgi:DNA mismatch repair protein MutL
MSEGPETEATRIAVLPAALADQIAAGEVVERPGSIVKELVDNAIDAGATRIEIELEGGGRERIRVLDDGRGIHREDLRLAITRHATSKLRTPEQLVEIHTLGFRGEALASIAAVARVEIRSRRLGESVGHRLASVPNEAATIEPIGMPEGTQIEVAQLFGNVPARRKFLRAEATEVGHCVDAVVRIALVHPRVGFRVRHDGRELLELRPASQTDRVLAILQRRGGVGPFHHFTGERDGVSVCGWFASPAAATRQRSASFVVVRRRVVRERTLTAALKQAYGDSFASGANYPVACLFVDPPRGTVDVNVHPQKSEVRFSAAQQVYAAVRELIGEGLASASWRREDDDGPEHGFDDTREHGWAAIGRGRPEAEAALAGWSRREGLGDGVARDGQGSGGGGGSRIGGGGGYRLGTRAAATDYQHERERFRGEVDRLRSSLAPGPRAGAFADREVGPSLPLPDEAFERREPADARGQPREAEPRDVEHPDAGPQLLTCLPGPVAVFEHDGELLVADLRRVRAHLVRRRLVQELAATSPDGQAPAQALLQPIVFPRGLDERARLLAAAAGLRRLGLELEGFGEGSVLVRAVPAALPRLLDARGVGALLDRLGPWLGLGDQSADSEPDGEPSAEPARGSVDPDRFADAVAQVEAGVSATELQPRIARRWIAELLAAYAGHPEQVEASGVQRWTVAALLHGARR